MNTFQRLNSCYKEANVIEFDDNDKFIMFSDIHRGDNSMSDEFAHNQNLYYHALNRYYEEGYTYIELGDGDELWEHSNFSVIFSAHSDVFMLLKKFYEKDRMHMLTGNHNVYAKYKRWVEANFYRFDDEYLDKRSDLFKYITCPESIILRYKETMKDILLVHGHQGDTFNDTLWPVSMMSLRFFWKFLHVLGFRNPSSPSKNRIKRHKIEKNFSNWIELYRQPIICGHTHRPKLAKKDEVPYFNTGCCIHPRGINGIEIVNGTISLVDWRVRPDRRGNLRIKKKIIRGPVKLTDYEYMRK